MRPGIIQHPSAVWMIAVFILAACIPTPEAQVEPSPTPLLTPMRPHPLSYDTLIPGSEPITNRNAERVKLLTEHEKYLSERDGLVFDADGTRLFTGKEMWDLSTNEFFRDFNHVGNVGSLALSPDGKSVVFRLEKSVELQDVITGKTQKTVSEDLPGTAKDAAFSPDGAILAVARCGVYWGESADFGVELWGAASGKLIAKLQDHEIMAPCAVAYSPDGKSLATGGWNVISFRDPLNGEIITEIKQQNRGVWDLEFSPDSTILASADDDGWIRLWDVPSKKLLTVMDGVGKGDASASNSQFRQNPVWSIAFSPDGSVLASMASWDNTTARMRLWEVSNGKLLYDFYRYPVGIGSRVAFSPDGKWLASSNDQGISLWGIPAEP